MKGVEGGCKELIQCCKMESKGELGGSCDGKEFGIF